MTIQTHPLPTGPDPETLWQLALTDLRWQMTRATFNAWLVGSRALPAASTATFLVVVVGNEYAADWLTHRLAPMVARTLVDLTGGPMVVCFVPGHLSTPRRTGSAAPLPAEERCADLC